MLLVLSKDFIVHWVHHAISSNLFFKLKKWYDKNQKQTIVLKIISVKAKTSLSSTPDFQFSTAPSPEVAIFTNSFCIFLEFSMYTNIYMYIDFMHTDLCLVFST